MEYYLGSADYGKIKEYVEDFNIRGVTCNPTIIIKDCAEIKKLVACVPENKEIFLQVISEDVEGIIRETKALMALREGIIVKIPATRNGFKAIRLLKEEGIKTLATAIYSVQQALMAANCGAAYVAPYVNRICNLEMDGIKTTLQIDHILKEQGSECKVIAASFKNMNQVNELMAGGIEAVTVGADLMGKIICSQNAEDASHDFVDAWEKYTGKRSLVLE